MTMTSLILEPACTGGRTLEESRRNYMQAVWEDVLMMVTVHAHTHSEVEETYCSAGAVSGGGGGGWGTSLSTKWHTQW